MTEHTPRCPRRLDPGRTAVLQRHIDGCPACRQFLESQQLVRDALDSWNCDAVSPGFNTRLFQHIRDDEKPAWAATIFALWIIAFPTTRDTVPPPDTTQAEQVERALEDLDMLQQLQPAVK